MVGNPLTDSLMGSFLIEVIGVFPNNPCQMPIMKDEGMVEAFSSQATHESFTYTIGSWCPVRCSQLLDA